MMIAAAKSSSAKVNWQKIVAPYKEGHAGIALWHLAAGMTILVVCWAGMALAYDMTMMRWVGLLLAIPAGAMLVKLFAIQHDCSHGAYLNQQWASDLIGRILCPLVMTPYTQWAREHAMHHATSGRLDSRGIGDVDTWTVAEYEAASTWQKIGYRILRNPLFLFGPGATLYFLVQQRFVRYQSEKRESWMSVWTTNVAFAGFIFAGCWLFGTGRFMWFWLPTVFVAAGLGTWIFYIGHQFPDTYWKGEEEWDFFEASMHGASFYRWGTIMDFISCNIGYHHVHHLCARIPFYNLPRCVAENPIFQIKELSFLESLPCAFLALWDEDNQRLVPFKS